MDITLITYIDDKKVLTEKYKGQVIFEENGYKINYLDKNNKKITITIDKINDNVSIIKESVVFIINKNRQKTEYETIYGILDLETKLIDIEYLERNVFTQFVINYKIYFSKIDFQNNKLKILIKRT